MSGIIRPGTRLLSCLLLWGSSASVLSLPPEQPTPAEIFPEPYVQTVSITEHAIPALSEDAIQATTFDNDVATPATPRKKRKKLSPINRLRQLYFLPLLSPLGGSH